MRATVWQPRLQPVRGPASHAAPARRQSAGMTRAACRIVSPVMRRHRLGALHAVCPSWTRRRARRVPVVGSMRTDRHPPCALGVSLLACRVPAACVTSRVVSVTPARWWRLADCVWRIAIRGRIGVSYPKAKAFGASYRTVQVRARRYRFSRPMAPSCRKSHRWQEPSLARAIAVRP